MTLRHLEILQAVARTGSFTRAAQSLFLTQSAVSHAVKELEERTGTALFDRLSKRVQPTSAGRRLLEQALPILVAAQSLEAGLDQLEEQAPLSLVSSITIATYWLPEILRQFRGRWPQTPVQVQVVSAADAMTVLRDGQADLALLEGSAPGEPFQWEAFASYEMCAVCGPDFPGAGETWTLARLSAAPLLLREPGSAIRDTLDSTLYLAGLTARPIWVSVNSGALVAAARAGLGVTVLPRRLVEHTLAQGQLRELPLRDVTLRNQLMAVWHRDKHWAQPLRALHELVTQKGPAAAEDLQPPGMECEIS